MKACYVVRPSFYELFSKYPNLFEYLHEFSDEQRHVMLEKFDIEELMKSAVSFFQTSIVMENNVLYLTHSVKEEVYCMECKDDFILLDGDGNPFLSLLKRKFRYFFVTQYE